MPAKKKTTRKGRTKIKDLPVTEREMTRAEKKKVKGGFAPVSLTGGDGGYTDPFFGPHPPPPPPPPNTGSITTPGHEER